MTFVDDDVLPALCAEALEQASAVEALNRREEMIESNRQVKTNPLVKIASRILEEETGGQVMHG